MSISVSGSLSSIKDVTIAITGKGEPNWSYIPTAGKTQKSNMEFVSEIKELAQKAALSTNKAESEYISRQVLQLRAEYLSDVAPDRKSMYQSAKNAMGRNNSSNLKCRGTGELTLLDFLEAADGRGNNLVYSIYWSEYRSAKGNSELSELQDYLEERSMFDAKA